jgi:hypothetical protein
MKLQYDKVELVEGCGVPPGKLATLPPQARQDIHLLLEDRELLSSNQKFERSWKLIDIQPVCPRLPLPSRSWIGWWKGEREKSDYLVVIKGETLETEGMTCPTRRWDPFRKPLSIKQRHQLENIRRAPAGSREHREPIPQRPKQPAPELTQEEIGEGLATILDRLGSWHS